MSDELRQPAFSHHSSLITHHLPSMLLAAIFHPKPITRARKGFRLMAETGRLRDDPLWFKDAVFYEVYVRGFYDSNGDGVGHFRALTEKLDYLEWLGVDCPWL